MAKATHYGICQWCGSRQKAPGQRIAKHGYKVAGYGFFNGVCRGSGHLPYELSCDLVKESIRAALGEARRLRERAGELRQPVAPGTRKAFVHHYESPSWADRRGGYRWIEVEVSVDDRCFGFSYETKSAGGLVKRNHRWLYGNPVRTSEGIVAALNSLYAEHLDKEASHLNAYAADQQERVNSWQPQELTPVAA